MEGIKFMDSSGLGALISALKPGQTLFSSTSEKISLINDSVARINGMAEVIENIAEQTNMLAP